MSGWDTGAWQVYNNKRYEKTLVDMEDMEI